MITVVGMEKGLDKIESYLESEIHEDGLLNDVTGIFIGEGKEGRPETPYIWITEEPITVDDTRPNPRKDYLKAPFVISGVCYDPDDLKKVYKDSKNLVSRVGHILEKGHHEDQDRWFKFLDFDNMDPNGAEIQEASLRVSQSVIVYNGIFKVSNMCLNKEKKVE